MRDVCQHTSSCTDSRADLSLITNYFLSRCPAWSALCCTDTWDITDFNTWFRLKTRVHSFISFLSKKEQLCSEEQKKCSKTWMHISPTGLGFLLALTLCSLSDELELCWLVWGRCRRSGNHRHNTINEVVQTTCQASSTPKPCSTIIIVTFNQWRHSHYWYKKK